ncbi:hypothetical protein AAH690_24900 [Escherichia coli]
MARIPEAELQHLKAAVSLVAVVQAQGCMTACWTSYCSRRW